MFLQTGKHGPYYTLYNFKCTGKMENSELKSLKVAGLLKYQVRLPYYTSTIHTITKVVWGICLLYMYLS